MTGPAAYAIVGITQAAIPVAANEKKASRRLESATALRHVDGRLTLQGDMAGVHAEVNSTRSTETIRKEAWHRNMVIVEKMMGLDVLVLLASSKQFRN
jgi:hypothetical protein